MKRAMISFQLLLIKLFGGRVDEMKQAVMCTLMSFR